MDLSTFDYDLPDDLIAQFPAERRDAARMLVMRRDSGACTCGAFAAIGSYLRPGDCLVLNDTKVIAARLHGTRIPSGGRIEAFMVAGTPTGTWTCFMKPARRLRPGDRIRVDGSLGWTLEVRERHPEGMFEVACLEGSIPDLLERNGHVPLPPYIRRAATAADRERYQTVYAAAPGAVAAPTAGLHFTPEVLRALAANGISIGTVTLHVGPGTFRPVTADRIDAHVMHEELYVLPAATADLVNRTRGSGGRVIAVGTTTVRTLESCADPATRLVHAGAGATRLFLYPPRQPLVCDGLLTNFHLPKSTLIMLVCCFSTVDHVMAAYRLAVRERLRFYSYGDCMLLLPDEA